MIFTYKKNALDENYDRPILEETTKVDATIPFMIETQMHTAWPVCVSRCIESIIYVIVMRDFGSVF